MLSLVIDPYRSVCPFHYLIHIQCRLMSLIRQIAVLGKIDQNWGITNLTPLGIAPSTKGESPLFSDYIPIPL